MLKHLKNLIEQITPENLQTANQAATQPVLEKVTAALMIQLARVDQNIADAEMTIIRSYTEQAFNLNRQELDKLIDEAISHADEATSLYEFTSLIHEQLSPGQKYEIILNLWRIAYADGHLDKYEEHFIRRAAELIYVPHPEFMRAKHEASG